MGFTVKGVYHLFSRLDIPFEGVLSITDLLNKIVRECPQGVVDEVVVTTSFKQLLVDTELSVDFDL